MGKKNREDRLTTRERLVLELVAEGLTHGEIASQSTISRRPVESHRSRLMEKGLKTRVDLVRFAIRHNIITA